MFDYEILKELIKQINPKWEVWVHYYEGDDTPLAIEIIDETDDTLAFVEL